MGLYVKTPLAGLFAELSLNTRAGASWAELKNNSSTCHESWQGLFGPCHQAIHTVLNANIRSPLLFPPPCPS
jgi:hypothetical protein